MFMFVIWFAELRSEGLPCCKKREIAINGNWPRVPGYADISSVQYFDILEGEDNVFIIGGRLDDEQGNETEQVDKFNIRNRRLIPATPLAYRRCKTACCSVEVSPSGDRTQRVNGIIICGGQNSEGESVKIVELFIPEQNR
ncbi:unnamed protein product [Dibothriocephalus latus]|uniref:Uncharacterized protein n=1 Tax=Dibothriocephalus latus TaxID=60516 RepID=A0A3P7LLU7_DIBLA|nr:unnamed protein product [Dibothriocephalus latus]